MPDDLPRRASGVIVSVSLALLALVPAGAGARTAAPEDIGAVAFQKKPIRGQSPRLTDYRLARRSQAEHTRVNVSWRAVNNTLTRGLPNLRAKADRRGCTTPSYDWCELDRLLRRFASIGLPANPVLIGTPEWANSRGCRVGGTIRACHPVPFAMDDWRRFVMSAVRRYGPNGSFWNALRAPAAFDMEVWEVWNEPNLGSFWDGTNRDAASRDAREYAALVEVTDRAVDAGALLRERAARIAGPSVSSFDPTGPGAWLRTFVAEDARFRLDLVSGHLYAETARGVVAQVDRYRKLLPTRPMWITENGFGSGSGCKACVGSARAQRRHFGRLMSALGARPYVRSFTWFMGARHPTFRGTHGLYRDNGRRKPVLKAFRARAARQY